MIAIVAGECTILILRKCGFKVCVILFCFYSINLEVFIYLPCINTQKRAIEPFDDTPVISSSDHQKTVLYQGSANRCEGYRNSDLIRLLHKSQVINYCNQSVLAIFPDLNVFVFSIIIVYLISRSALLRL